VMFHAGGDELIFASMSIPRKRRGVAPQHCSAGGGIPVSAALARARAGSGNSLVSPPPPPRPTRSRRPRTRRRAVRGHPERRRDGLRQRGFPRRGAHVRVAAGQPYDPKESGARSGGLRHGALHRRHGERRARGRGCRPDGFGSPSERASKRSRSRGAKKIEEKDPQGKAHRRARAAPRRWTLELDAREDEAAYGQEGYAPRPVLARTEPVAAGAVRVVFDIQEGTKVQGARDPLTGIRR